MAFRMVPFDKFSDQVKIWNPGGVGCFGVHAHTSLEFMSPEKKFAKQVDGTTKFFGSNAKFWYFI